MSHTISLLQFEYAWEIHAYMRFANIQYEEHNAEYPSVDLTGELPQLTVDGTILSAPKMIKYLKQNVVDLDKEFPKDIQDEINLYRYIINNYSNTVHSIQKWSNLKQLHKYLSPIYSSILEFPYNYVYYYNQNKKNKALMGVTVSTDEKEREDMLNNVYRVLNEKLHSSEHLVKPNNVHFLYGEKPCSLDAALFAHIARVFEFPAGLQNQLLNYPTLVQYYETIMKYYFSASYGEKTTNNKAYGYHLSCQPTKSVNTVLPYKHEAREYDNVEIMQEEKQEEEKVTIDETFETRKQFVTYTGIGALVFAFALFIDFL